MNNFLDAECVFSSFISSGIFVLKVWKNTLGEKPSYNVIFEFAESARRAGFIVYIRDNRHCIGLTSLLNIARKFQINLGDITTRCAVEF